MENTHSFKCSLVTVWKIFKYGFISYARVFVPICIAMLIMGMVVGLVNNYGTAHSLLETSSLSILFILLGGAGFTYIAVVQRRFRTEMLGDEAYLNLTLPVSIGEHLWGRFCSSFVWLFIGLFSVCLSIAEIDQPFFAKAFIVMYNELSACSAAGILLIASYCMALILFIFFECVVVHQFRRFRAVAHVFLSVATISLFLIIGQEIGPYDTAETLLLFAINIGFCAAFFAVSWGILSRRLNLE